VIFSIGYTDGRKPPNANVGLDARGLIGKPDRANDLLNAVRRMPDGESIHKARIRSPVTG
jgi:hypothetical protein